jgi:HAMP domain-containing protein/signal transduction histidine kinase/CheY-like chemotaxis protein
MQEKFAKPVPLSLVEKLDGRLLLRVLTDFRKGDFSARLPVDSTGIAGKIYDTINEIIDLNGRLTKELDRISNVVGKEGKIRQRASLSGATGGWSDCVDSVNSLVGDLIQPITDVSRVIGAVAKGDLSQSMDIEVEGRRLTGEFQRTARTVNTMVEQLSTFTSEVIRVAREVGTEGKLGGQAKVKGVSGAWKDLTDNVNSMAANLTNQVRNIAEVTTAVAKGDLSKKITVDVRGEILELKNTINTMVDQLNSFASEVTRVAREVGTEGRLGGQAVVKGVGGTWKDLTDSVNSMANNLTRQVRNIAEVTTAVARGDLSKKITVDVRGEILELKNTINIMVDQLNSFASEVTRVAREVGTEGKLGGQADVKGVGGTWKDLTDSVNFMASNLTNQVRNIAAVTTAVAKGDLSKKITVDARGEILELKNTVNTMVDQLNSFASEVTRVAREVGTEGRLGGQADVKGVGGTWKDLTDSVNFMAGNLTAQVRNIAEVSTAIANGDLSKKITVDVKGEILELKNTINTMVDQLNSFASEVTRVAREVGTEGRLGGQAEVGGVAGTWRDLTESVNFMASNLTNQVRNIAAVTTAVANGDLSKKITVDARGEILELKNTVNTMVDQLNSFASEVTRVAREVGTEGKLGGQADVRGVAGTWKDLTDNVNSMASNLTNQVRNIAAVTTAVANGDLSKKITVEARGEILELKNTVNTMVDQLNSFASEVTRVAREVGTEGRLGGQAEVKGVAGTWKDLTDSVNFMASNLTNQVRSISKVVTSVANGNLKRKLVLEAKGEIEQLAETINEMIDTLATFAEQVTTVAREVGIEGKLGGQANVPNAAGTWRDLTNNVNRMAAALTSQVRAIADVATAVTKGDLSQSITVDAAGEVAALKDNINEMIRNLRETTKRNTEQDWLKTNLARFTRLLQGQRDLLAVSKLILTELAPLANVQHGVFYINEATDGEPDLRLVASYAFNTRKHIITRIRAGEGIAGQAVLEKQRILLTEVPGDYIQIGSAMGEARPANVIVLPVLFEGQVKAVIELASFHRFSDIHITLFDQLTEIIGIMLNTITATMRTEELLKQSQSLATELQSRQTELTETNAQLQLQARTLQESEERLKAQQEELQQTNEELEEKARLLFQQNKEVERKNAEIEKARASLEEKAAQLALTSKYKSEFLANMSHELRTPLSSMLILSRLLGDNEEHNLFPKQVEYAQTIHSSGEELLELINEILDLSRIESGAMEIEPRPLAISDLRDYVVKGFEAIAQSKGLKLSVEIRKNAPKAIFTDAQRLQQILKNLLSNAFKFTHDGSVSLKIESVGRGWSPGHKALDRADQVVALSVVDTGIGIALDKQRMIFEPFQQADGTITRKYGGTGLGLSISREIANLLGGELRVTSEPGKGSTFILYLPRKKHGATEAATPEKLEEERLRESEPRVQEIAPVADDRLHISDTDLVLLIIDPSPDTAQLLLNLSHDHGFKGIVTTQAENAVPLAHEFKPDAISINPDKEGWLVFDRFKRDLGTRHIPVQIIADKADRQRAMSLGAFVFSERRSGEDALANSLEIMQKFLSRDLKSLLVVEDDEEQRKAILDLIADGDVETVAAASGDEAIAALRSTHFDCIVVDVGLPDMSGFELLERIKKELGLYDLPVIVYTGKDLSNKEETRLRQLAETIIIKDARSPERLLAETALCLHRSSEKLSPIKRRMLEEEQKKDVILAGKKVLVIDDDVRNIFSLTSLLERHQMDVMFAENGREALQVLKDTPGIDAILVDVMMPDMDGYETMREIRQMRRFQETPMIALTAKAMKDDKEKCLAAGASDYVSKPADVDRLLSLLRVYLGK